MRAVDLLVIHCSATKSGARLPGLAEVAIDKWHRERGFNRGVMAAKFNPQLPAIGYHFVIDLDGRIANGRSAVEIGAHVADFNARSIGICMVGGVETVAQFTLQQWQSLAALVPRICSALAIPIQAVTPGKPVGICGHRDLSPDTNRNGKVESREWLKTCPGFDVSAWLAAGMTPPAAQIFPRSA